MCRKNKFESVVKCMTATLGSIGKPFTVKMRTGVKIGKYFAHTLIPFCKNTGVSMLTVSFNTILICSTTDEFYKGNVVAIIDTRHTLLVTWQNQGSTIFEIS